jgi:ferritin-like metal-binding protein YciE
MFSGTTNEQLREELVTYLQNIYFVESQFTNTLEHYAEETKQFKEFPEFQATLNDYLVTAKPFVPHIAERLSFYNVQPPFQPIPNSYIANVVNCFTSFRPNTFAEYVVNFYAIEHFKIGIYRVLNTIAYAFNDKETLKFAEWGLRENLKVQQWVFQHIPEVCLYSFEHEGIPIPQSAWDFAKQLESMGTTAPYLPPTR